MTPRFEIIKHTDDDEWCFRVLDTHTLETFGYGLRFDDAVWLAVQHDQHERGGE